MLAALLLGLAAAVMGWRRAARRGGNRADRVQYAAVHGIAVFLVVLIVMTIAGNMGLLW